MFVGCRDLVVVDLPLLVPSQESMMSNRIVIDVDFYTSVIPYTSLQPKPRK